MAYDRDTRKWDWELEYEKEVANRGWWARKCYDWGLGEPGSHEYRQDMAVLLQMGALVAAFILVIAATTSK